MRKSCLLTRVPTCPSPEPRISAVGVVLLRVDGVVLVGHEVLLGQEVSGVDARQEAIRGGDTAVPSRVYDKWMGCRAMKSRERTENAVRLMVDAINGEVHVPIAEGFAVRRPAALVRAFPRRPNRPRVSDERGVKVVARAFRSVAI